MRVVAKESCEAEDVCRHPEVEQPRDQGELGGGEAEAGEQQVLAGVGAEAGTRRIFAAFWCIFKLISWRTLLTKIVKIEMKRMLRHNVVVSML